MIKAPKTNSWHFIWSHIFCSSYECPGLSLILLWALLWSPDSQRKYQINASHARHLFPYDVCLAVFTEDSCMLHLERLLMRAVRLNQNKVAGCKTNRIKWKILKGCVDLRGAAESGDDSLWVHHCKQPHSCFMCTQTSALCNIHHNHCCVIPKLNLWMLSAHRRGCLWDSLRLKGKLQT